MASKLFVGLLGAAAFGTAAASAVSNGFLYAYSTGINGFPLININNTLYISNSSISDLDKAYSVNFTQESNTISATSNGSTAVLGVPTSPGPVILYKDGVSNGPKEDVVTNGWVFFEGTLAMEGSASLETLFYAVSTDTPNLFLVSWNITGNIEPLAIRLISPY